MENQNEKNAPHGTLEPVPIRSGGNNEQISTRNHATYGTDPAMKIPEHINTYVVDKDVNDTKTPNNPTKNERIWNEDSFMNHSMAP